MTLQLIVEAWRFSQEYNIHTHKNCRINKIEKELITFKSDKLETYCKKLNSPKVSLLAALESINNEDRVTKKEIYKQG